MHNLILTVMLAMASLFGMTAQVDNYTVGKEYIELSSPVPVPQSGKIEVVELFWYGCPHCYAFESTIVPWSERLSADVHFVCLSVLLGGIWNVHGQMFLALESMGVEHGVHNAVFKAIYKEHRKLATPEEMADFLAGKGVGKGKLLSIYNSFAIKGQMEKVKKLAMVCQATGILTMVVNGKYHFDIGSVNGPEETLKLADYPIEKGHTVAKKQARRLGILRH